MQSSIFARWARGHRFESHVVLPAAISLLLMAMYFSGNATLQNIVAPDMENMPLFSAREFGALEMLQNFFLLCIGFYSIRCFMATGDSWVRLVTLLLFFISVFVFLEEIDYGAPFIEYFTGVHGSLAAETWDRNWHNKTSASGVQNVSYLKLMSNIGLLAGFVLAPLTAVLGAQSNPEVAGAVPVDDCNCRSDCTVEVSRTLSRRRWLFHDRRKPWQPGKKHIRIPRTEYVLYLPALHGAFA